MIDEDQNNPNDHNVKSTQEKYTPQRVIVNAAEFNRKFNDFEIGGDRATVSMGKMLTVMGEQDNIIRMLSRILGEITTTSICMTCTIHYLKALRVVLVIPGEGMHLANLLTHLTAFFHEQNQQIQKLIDELRECVKQARIAKPLRLN